MERHVWLVANHPTVVGLGRNVEQLTRAQLCHATIGERGRRDACQHEAEVLDLAALLAERATHVLRPSPTRLVRRAADRHPPETHDFEPAQRELTHLVRLLEAAEDHIGVRYRRRTREPPHGLRVAIRRARAWILSRRETPLDRRHQGIESRVIRGRQRECRLPDLDGIRWKGAPATHRVPRLPGGERLSRVVNRIYVPALDRYYENKLVRRSMGWLYYRVVR